MLNLEDRQDAVSRRVAYKVENFFEFFTTSTAKSYRAEWKRLNAWAYPSSPVTLKPAMCMNYVKHLRSLGSLSSGSLHRIICILVSIYDFLVDEGLAIRNPWRTVRRQIPAGNAGTIRPTEAVDIQIIFKMIDLAIEDERLDVAAMFALLVGAGLRIGELVKVNYSDLRKTPAGNPMVMLRNTKNGTDTQQAIIPEFYAIVEQYLDTRLWSPKDALFPSRYRLARHRQAISIRNAARCVRDYAHRVAPSQRIHPHAFRAAAITELLRQGYDYEQVREFSRHSDTKTVRLYDKRYISVEENPAFHIKALRAPVKS